MRKVFGVLVIAAGWLGLLWAWLACGVPHTGADVGACIFSNFALGIVVPVFGVAIWRADD